MTIRIHPDLDQPLKDKAAELSQRLGRKVSVTGLVNDAVRLVCGIDPVDIAVEHEPPASPAGPDNGCPHANTTKELWGTMCNDCGEVVA